MIGKVVHGRPHHLGRVRDRLETRCANQLRPGGVPVVDEDLEDLLGLVVLRGDLAEALLVPREERAADAASTEGRVDEANLAVGARPVGFLIPPDAAVRDRPTVDLGDQEIALGSQRSKWS
jgi:hypothetical protein